MERKFHCIEYDGSNYSRVPYVEVFIYGITSNFYDNKNAIMGLMSYKHFDLGRLLLNTTL